MLSVVKKLFRVRVGYVLKYTRVLAPSGEQFEVTTNLPPNATKAQFDNAFNLMGGYPEARMHYINETLHRSDMKDQAETPLNREQRRALEKIARKQGN